MKRLIAFLGLVFATAAMAADNPVACSGASCKIVFETRNSSNVKQVVATFANGIYEATTTNATTGTINDLAWTTPIVRFTGSGAVTLTGVVAQPSGTRFTVHNDTGNPLIFASNTTSSALNRILTGSTGDVTIYQNGMASFIYGNDRWRIVSGDVDSGSAALACTTISNAGATCTTNFCSWMRVQKEVTVACNIQANPASSNPAADANLIVVEITLPIATNLTSFTQLSGSGSHVPSGGANLSEVLSISGNSVNDKAVVTWRALATGARNMAIHFSYIIQ